MKNIRLITGLPVFRVYAVSAAVSFDDKLHRAVVGTVDVAQDRSGN